MTASRSNSHPESGTVLAEDSLRLGAVQVVDVVSGVVQDLDEFGQRVHIVIEPAPTVIADSGKLAEVTESLLRSALESAPSSAPIEVEVAARCLAQFHDTAGSDRQPEKCQALVSVAIRDLGVETRQPTRSATPNPMAETGIETALMSAQNVVRLHQGRLWVTARPEHGRTLGFCLNSEQAA